MEMALLVYEPLPSARAMLPAELLFDARQTSVRFATQVPIGYAGAAIGVPIEATAGGPLWLPRHELMLRPRSRVQVLAGSQVLYEGMLTKAHWRGGYLSGIELAGYGSGPALNTVPFASADNTARTTGDVIQRVLTACVPGLAFDQSRWGDPGVAHTLAEFDGMYANQVLDQLLKEGGVDGRVWDFVVWAGPLASLTPRVTPLAPAYRLPVNEVDEITEDYSSMAGTVRVRYRVPANDEDSLTADAVDDGFINRYGWDATVTLEGGALSSAGALAFRDAQFARLRQPARSLSLTAGSDGLLMDSGTRQPPHLVRAGEWLQVLGTEAPELIVSTDYDNARETATVRTGAASGDFADMFAHVRRVAASVEQRISPVSGGRTR